MARAREVLEAFEVGDDDVASVSCRVAATRLGLSIEGARQALLRAGGRTKTTWSARPGVEKQAVLEACAARPDGDALRATRSDAEAARVLGLSTPGFQIARTRHGILESGARGRGPRARPEILPQIECVKRRREVTVPAIEGRRGRLWAYGYVTLGRLFGVKAATVRLWASEGKLDPADLHTIVRLAIERTSG